MHIKKLAWGAGAVFVGVKNSIQERRKTSFILRPRQEHKAWVRRAEWEPNVDKIETDEPDDFDDEKSAGLTTSIVKDLE